MKAVFGVIFFLLALSVFRADVYSLEQLQSPMTMQESAWERLLEGNKRFANNKPISNVNVAEARKEAKSLHMPVAAILSCSDARVGPELIFDQGVGDLFVVRVAGNILNEDGIGSLEYAVQFLHAPLVLIMGHTKCGALEAFLKVLKKGDFLNGYIESLVLSVYPATKYLKDLSTATTSDLVAANVRAVKNKLLNSSQIIGERVKTGSLKVVGAVYDLETGLVTPLEDHSEEYSNRPLGPFLPTDQ